MNTIIKNIVLSDSFTNEEKYDLIEMIINANKGIDVLEGSNYYLGIIKAKSGNQLIAIHRFDDKISSNADEIITLLYNELGKKQNKIK